MLAEQLVQFVLAEVVVGQLEQALLDREAQPDDGAAHQGRRPRDRADDPRPANRRQLSRGGLIKDEGRVGVFLQKAGADGVGQLFLDRLAHDRRLVLAEGHDDDLARLHDRADAHGQRLVRHVVFAEEVARGITPRHRIERHRPRPALARRARLVEADVPAAADAEDLQIDASGPANHLLVVDAMLVHFAARHRAVRYVDVLLGNVDVAEKRLVHPAAIAVRVVGRHRVVFVEVEGDDARKIEPRVLVQPNQLTVQPDRRRARGQAEHRGPVRRVVLADQALDHQRHMARRLGGGGKDERGDFRVWKIVGSHGKARWDCVGIPIITLHHRALL